MVSRRRVAHVGLESFNGPLLCLLPIDVWFWIPQFFEFFFTESVIRRKDRLALDILQLWYPYAKSVSGSALIISSKGTHIS